jgi:hypothetical protein
MFSHMLIPPVRYGGGCLAAYLFRIGRGWLGYGRMCGSKRSKGIPLSILTSKSNRKNNVTWEAWWSPFASGRTRKARIRSEP